MEFSSKSARSDENSCDDGVQQVEFVDPRAKYLNKSEVFADEIASVLEGSFQRQYLTQASRSDRRNLNEGLRGVERWKDLGEEKTRPDFRENNLDHVITLLSWCREIALKYPDLLQEVTDGKPENRDDLLTMLIIHDLGEIATGDICRSHPDFHTRLGKIHKRKEAYAAWKMLGLMESGHLSAKLRHLYKRFDRRDTADKPVNLGHFLDKIHSTATLAKEIIPHNAADQNYSAERIYKRETGGLEYAERLAAALKTERAKAELAELIEEKVVGHYDRLELAVITDVQVAVRKRIKENIIGRMK